MHPTSSPYHLGASRNLHFSTETYFYQRCCDTLFWLIGPCIMLSPIQTCPRVGVRPNLPEVVPVCLLFSEPQSYYVSASKTLHSSHNSVLILFVLASSSIACRTGALVTRSLCSTKSLQPRELVYRLLRRSVSERL
jgi:hypothetical protein